MYFIEAGLVLLVAPWSTFWERNWLLDVSPLLDGVLRLTAVRGAVSGVGLVNLCAGMWALAASLAALIRPVAAAGVPRAREPEPIETTPTGIRGEEPSSWPEGP